MLNNKFKLDAKTVINKFKNYDLDLDLKKIKAYYFYFNNQIVYFIYDKVIKINNTKSFNYVVEQYINLYYGYALFENKLYYAILNAYEYIRDINGLSSYEETNYLILKNYNNVNDMKIFQIIANTRPNKVYAKTLYLKEINFKQNEKFLLYFLDALCTHNNLQSVYEFIKTEICWTTEFNICRMYIKLNAKNKNMLRFEKYFIYYLLII